MFYYLHGKVTHREPGLTVIDCGGVGYVCQISLQTLGKLQMGEVVKLYTRVNIREDAYDIFGFYDTSERDCFKMLTSISGVGPKAALSILGVNTPERLALSVLGSDEKALTQAPGIGKKLAQRIILELKDKMGKADLQSASGQAMQVLSLDTGILGEATAALGVLGYSAAEAGMALKGVDTDGMIVEQLIKIALKNLMPKF